MSTKKESKEPRHIIYMKAVEKWGCRAQYEMAQEEFTEASLAVRKFYRKGGEEAFVHLAEEIADAKIMIEQIELMNPTIGLLINEFISMKVARLEERVNVNDFEKL